MLKTTLLHPEILRHIAGCGHFSQVLIADGNFPATTMSRRGTPIVFLNLMPGVPTVTQVLQALLTILPLQEAAVIQPPEEKFRAIFREYSSYLPQEVKVEECERWSFYDKVKSDNTGLIIVTGDHRRFANLLLTVGVQKHAE
jgi:L-fucose mutarotase